MINEYIIHQSIKTIKSLLTDDLRKKKYKGNPIRSAGHCYVASETLYHFLGGKSSGLKPMFIRYDGEPHWFLMWNDLIIDATCDQFYIRVPYSRAKGKGFLTKFPSKRSKILLDRLYKESLSWDTIVWL